MGFHDHLATSRCHWRHAHSVFVSTGLSPFSSLRGFTRIHAPADRLGHLLGSECERQLLADKVSVCSTSVASTRVNVAPKLATIIAWLCAGTDSIDDDNEGPRQRQRQSDISSTSTHCFARATATPNQTPPTDQNRRKQILRKDLVAASETIRTDHAAPVIAGIRLRAGTTASGKAITPLAGPVIPAPSWSAAASPTAP